MLVHIIPCCDSDEVKNSSCVSDMVQIEQQSGLIKTKVNVDVTNKENCVAQTPTSKLSILTGTSLHVTIF